MTPASVLVVIAAASLGGFVLGYTTARMRIARLRKASLMMRLGNKCP